MIDRSCIGKTVSRHSVLVEKGRLRFFLKAIGAQIPGADAHGELTVPLTYLFSLDMERPDPYDWFAEVGLELSRVLHGEQSFRYYSPCRTGDTLRFETTVEDVYERHEGDLGFLVKRTRVTAADGRHVADLGSTIVQRHPHLPGKKTMPEVSSIEPGHQLPKLALPPMSRTTLALYAGASGDHNPIHIDIDAARAAGMNDVFAQGMLAMAYLGRLLSGWVEQSQVHEFRARFTNIVHVSDELTCSGMTIPKIATADNCLVPVYLRVGDQHGDVKIIGSALIRFEKLGDE